MHRRVRIIDLVEKPNIDWDEEYNHLMKEIEENCVKGQEQDWRKFNGYVSCMVLQEYLRKHLRDNLSVVGPPAFVRGQHRELDMLIVDKSDRSPKFGIHDVSNVHCVLEVKRRGVYRKDDLDEIFKKAEIFKEKFVYVSIIWEDYLAELRKMLGQGVFVLSSADYWRTFVDTVTSK